MSSLRARISRAVSHGSTEDAVVAQKVGKYKLYITAGPSYDRDTHRVVQVNSGNAIEVENEFVRAKIVVRIRDYRGLPSDSPFSSPYFDDPVHERDLYSIAFSFVPNRDLPAADTVWGNDFDHPIKLPPGFNTAFKIVKEFIDQGLSCDAYADEPWLYGSSLTSWFALRIGDRVDEHSSFPAPQDETAMEEGADGEGRAIREKMHIPPTYSARHKFFLSAANREKFTFEKGRLYQGDFYNPYLDFGNIALRLPGFTMKVIKHLENKSHCLRYVFKNQKTGEVYFNVNFNLLYGEQLDEAVKEDEQRRLDQRDRVNRQSGSASEHSHAAAGAQHQPVTTENNQPHQGGSATQAEQSTMNNITKMMQKTSASETRGETGHVLDDDELD